MSDEILHASLSLAIPPARGRVAKALDMDFVREIGEPDIEALQNPGQAVTPGTKLASIRHSHHQAARLLAGGTPAVEVGLITGYSQSRLSILQRDPAFRELMEYYGSQVDAKYLDVHERLASLGLSTLDEIQERLEAKPDSISTPQLLQIAEFALDRSVTKESRPGHGTPSGAVTNFTVVFKDSPHANTPIPPAPHQVIDIDPE